MKLFALLALVGISVAAHIGATPSIYSPLYGRASNNGFYNETDVGQLALYVEHLEIALYFTAFARFSKQDFISAGFDDFYYQTIQDFLHEHQYQANWMRLNFAFGADGPGANVKACSYSFPFTDVKSFINLSAVLESFATSFYLGLSYYLAIAPDREDILSFAITTPASIAAVNAKHVAIQRMSLKQNATDINFFPYLGLNVSYTYAKSFAKSCPSDGYQLPFTALPAVTPNATQVRAGQVLGFYSPLTVRSGSFGLFIYGENNYATILLTAGEKPGHFHTTVPSGVNAPIGQVYFLVTEYDGEPDSVLAGPVVLQISP